MSALRHLHPFDEFRMVVSGTDPLEGCLVGGENTRNTWRFVDEARFSQTSHRPTGAIEKSLEPDIGYCDDLVVAVEKGPFRNCSKHGPGRQMQRTPLYSVTMVDVDTEARAFDHGRMRAERLTTLKQA